VTAFTFSVEQLRSAPPEVRRWVVNEIGRALGGVSAALHSEPRQAESVALATCTAQEALQIFELIGGDAITARLFFELARSGTLNSGLPGLQVFRTADLLHHAGLTSNDSLLDGLALIDRAFRQVHGEPAGSLFGYDDAGHIYIHEATQASVRRVWEELVQARAGAERQPASFQAVPRPASFNPPHLGPSEDIAAHGARPHPEAGLPL
jgi:hypothetical protein